MMQAYSVVHSLLSMGNFTVTFNTLQENDKLEDNYKFVNDQFFGVCSSAIPSFIFNKCALRFLPLKVQMVASMLHKIAVLALFGNQFLEDRDDAYDEVESHEPKYSLVIPLVTWAGHPVVIKQLLRFGELLAKGSPRMKDLAFSGLLIPMRHNPLYFAVTLLTGVLFQILAHPQPPGSGPLVDPNLPVPVSTGLH